MRRHIYRRNRIKWTALLILSLSLAGCGGGGDGGGGGETLPPPPGSTTCVWDNANSKWDNCTWGS